MDGASAAVPEIVVGRYRGLDAPAETWRIRRSDGAWTAVAPDGTVGVPHPSALEALAASGACRYKSGVGLHIRTGGLVSPFGLLPALDSWKDPAEAESEPVDWSQHSELGWTQEVLNYWPAGEALGLEPSRVIRVDEGFIGVHTDGRDAQGRNLRHLIVVLETDPPRPAFFEPWASVSADNGWGWVTHDIGEIVPGLMGEVTSSDGWGPMLTVRPLPEDHPQGLYESTVAWVSGCIADTIEEFELEIDGGSVTAVIPEDAPYGEASGRLEPAVLRSQAPNPE